MGRLVGIMGRPDLTDADAHRVVQLLVLGVVTEMEYRPHDLPAPGRVRPAVAVALDVDGGAVVGLDDGPEVRHERTVGGTSLREVRPAEAPADRALTRALGEVEVLLPSTFEVDGPALGIAEADPVQRFEPHAALLLADPGSMTFPSGRHHPLQRAEETVMALLGDGLPGSSDVAEEILEGRRVLERVLRQGRAAAEDLVRELTRGAVDA